MLFFTHLNLLIRKDKPHQGRSFDTSTGSWQCCLGRKKIQRSHRLASGSLSLWKTVSRGNTDKFLLQVKPNVSFLFRKFSLWFIQTWIHLVSLCSRVLCNNLGAHVCVCVFQYLAIVGTHHLVLQQLCQLTEDDTVVQLVHQSFCCDVSTWAENARARDRTGVSKNLKRKLRVVIIVVCSW